MAKKIEGWANGNPASPGSHFSFTDLNSGVGDRATLVIGNERVFTESEVRAIFNAMIQQRYEARKRGDFVEVRDIVAVAEENGIVLDPA